MDIGKYMNLNVTTDVNKIIGKPITKKGAGKTMFRQKPYFEEIDLKHQKYKVINKYLIVMEDINNTVSVYGKTKTPVTSSNIKIDNTIYGWADTFALNDLKETKSFFNSLKDIDSVEKQLY